MIVEPRAEGLKNKDERQDKEGIYDRSASHKSDYGYGVMARGIW
jgi:hypothetical protein